MTKLLSLLFLLTFSLDSCGSCRTPTTPTPAEDIAWDCVRVLTHPVRQTYVLRCTHPVTGAVEIRDDP